MTPTELVNFVRQKQNSVGDDFWSDSEILNLIWAASFEIAREAFVIETTYTVTTVVGTQQYSYPTNTIAVKRVTYNGQKLTKINMREDDQLTGQNQATTTTGNPIYYYEWGNNIYLRPIPNDTKSLVVFSYNEPQQLTTTSVIEVPSQYHLDMADYVLSAMSAKEKNFQGAQYYKGQWEQKLLKIKMFERKRLRTDSNANVQDIDSMNQTLIGIP